MNYGLQLFSIRDITEQDLDDALRQVSKIGYSFVEFAGFFGHTSTEIIEMLKKYNLQVSGTHTGAHEISEHFDETVKFHKAIGNKNIIIPSAELETKAKVDAFVELLNKYGQMLAKEGIKLHYHNHDFEFKANDDGVIAFDEILSKTNVGMEIDTFWVYAAKKSPTELMEKLKDRISVIHIKDGYENGDGMPLGHGTAPVYDVWEKAVELGVTMVVESETLTPDGISEAETCFTYLKNL